MDAGVGESRGFDASQKATMSLTDSGSEAQTVRRDHNLEIFGKLLERVRLTLMAEMNEEDLPTMEDVNEAVKASNAHKRAWTEMSQKKSPIEERVIALE